MNNYKSINFDKKIPNNFNKLFSHNKIVINKIPNVCKAHSLLSLPKIKNKNALNIFNKLKPSETQHSIILGGLLNPRGEHGQGDTFLQIFLLLFSIPLENNDSWFVTVEKERFDIKISNKQKTKIIIIENKQDINSL